MKKYKDELLRKAHKHCTRNKKALEVSKTCACFWCLRVYSSKLIKEWADGCAICPFCHIDAVLPSKSGLPLRDHRFLEEMHEYWFGK